LNQLVSVKIAAYVKFIVIKLDCSNWLSNGHIEYFVFEEMLFKMMTKNVSNYNCFMISKAV